MFTKTVSCIVVYKQKTTHGASGFYVRMPAPVSAASHACVVVLSWTHSGDWHDRELFLNKVVIFVFVVRKNYYCILTMSLPPFCALNVLVVLLSMQGQKVLRFHQKYLNLCFEDERRSYVFGTTWGWVINDNFNFWVNYTFKVPMTALEAEHILPLKMWILQTPKSWTEHRWVYRWLKTKPWQTQWPMTSRGTHSHCR